jgi:F-type H+-transporting ATPase subunit a
MFCAILMFNLMGIIPGLNVAATALIGLPLMLAAWTYVTYLSAGVRELGVGGFLKNNLFPPGVPPFFYVLLTPVEFLQVFIVRPATLALRLMANMVSGHLMLALCFSATQYFLFETVPAMKGFGALTFVGGFIFTLFEVFVATLQAYIFVILTAVYIELSVSKEH